MTCEVGPSGLFPSCGLRQAQDGGSQIGLVTCMSVFVSTLNVTSYRIPSVAYPATPHCSQVLPGISFCVYNPLLGLLYLSVCLIAFS